MKIHTATIQYRRYVGRGPYEGLLPRAALRKLAAEEAAQESSKTQRQDLLWDPATHAEDAATAARFEKWKRKKAAKLARNEIN
jgi:hypothetical protein